MDFYLEKYSYVKLNHFLLVQPIYRELGCNKVTSEFAATTKKEAQAQGIVILQGDVTYCYGKGSDNQLLPKTVARGKL